MKHARPSSPCPDCARAHAFIADVIGGGPAVEPDVDDWIASLASLLDTALGHLLRDFDYAAKPDSPTASAARHLALCADQLHRVNLHAAQRERILHLLRAAARARAPRAPARAMRRAH